MTVFFVIGFIILQLTDLETDMKKIADADEFDNPWDDVLEDILDVEPKK
jgi:hypothetical protein